MAKATEAEDLSGIFDADGGSELSLNLNFSNEEASSEARSFEALPAGKYAVKITGIDLRRCKPGTKNAGKPYWAVEFTVQDGPYENRKVWSNVMLFDGALYSISQLLKATGLGNPSAGQFKLPSQEAFISKDVVVYVSRRNYTPEGGETQIQNDVKSYFSPDTAVSAASSTDLP
jgi:hypothetical protein